uniref:Ribosome biogenesis protein NOP53 n=1 Tax=Odontella aurita TaxID=265563 RepID=A0A6U6HF66_9STRA|mmetsp:Transcript_47806/g.144566  ORF Transcript_47806/g.144566 Transcript_47806/m.144566 type:complete len:447 (+) Transcript_47806:89-1429(+)
MGKNRKQGASLRAKRRADAAAKEIVETTASKVATSRIESKPDDELFVLDSAPDAVHHLAVPKKKRKVDDKGNKLPKNRVSEMDDRKAKKLIAAHTEDGVAKLAADGRIALAKKRRTKRQAGLARTNYDLWDDDEGIVADDGRRVKKIVAATSSGVAAPGGVAPVALALVPKTPRDHRVLDASSAGDNVPSKLRKAREAAALRARPSVGVDVALQGQSYRPDPEAHQDAIGEALAVELRRNEVKEYNQTPVGGGGLSEETKAVMVGSDDDSDSDDDRDEGGGNAVQLHKKREKLTTAQRNKQRRLKAEKFLVEKRKTDKRLLNSVNETKKFTRELSRKEVEDAERRERLAALKAERESKPVGKDLHDATTKSFDPLRAPAVPVALTSELKEGGGSLRTVKPKGNLIIDRIESMRARKMAGTKVYDRKLRVGGKKRKNIKGAKEQFVV